MRFTYHYESKDYPGFPKLSKKSQRIGMLTCGTWVFLVYGFLWLAIVAGLLENLGMEYDTGVWIAIASLIGLYFVLKNYRKKAFAKLDQEYIDSVNALRTTDPQKFYEIMMELQRRKG